MAVLTTAHTFMTTLQAQLAARSGLIDVQVASAPMEGDSAPESIQLFGVEIDQEWAALGNQDRWERYVVTGATWTVVAGAGEETIQEARARADALLKELADELRTNRTMNDTVRITELISAELEQGVNPDGRWCQISFKIGVAAYLSS